MKSRMPISDMLEMAQTKNPSRRYFRLRSGKSSQRGRKKLRPKSFFPAPHRYSENVPAGQSQLQNALRNKNAMERNVSSRNIAAGCTFGISPLRNQYFRF